MDTLQSITLTMNHWQPLYYNIYQIILIGLKVWVIWAH